MHLFRGDQRKALAQIETHLVAEHTACAGAGAVRFFNAMRVHMAHEIFVGRGDGVGRAHEGEFKGLAFRYCEARRAVADSAQSFK